jgi:plastocyanin
MVQHIISITQDQFVPSSIRIMAGDSVVWDNRDSRDHTATSNSRGYHFDTGVIKAGARSSAVLFPAASSYGGVEVTCSLHGSMEGRIFVSGSGERPAVTAAQGMSGPDKVPVEPGATYSLDTWRSIARIVAAHWIYDMADNFSFGKVIHRGDPLTKLSTEWAAIESFWQSQTGSTKTILDNQGVVDPSSFMGETRERLEILGRRIRGARRRLRVAGVNVPQYPFPDRPDDPDAANPFGRLYGGQSSDPFGEAITVNYAGLRASPDPQGALRTEVQHAEVRHEDYALGPLWTIESKQDSGDPITDDDKQAYRTKRAALLIDDYHTLAVHLYFGLSKLFKSEVFQEDQFIAGIRRMTARGEWDGSWTPMWHWLRWIDGYITVKETGQLPDPLGLQA